MVVHKKSWWIALEHAWDMSKHQFPRRQGNWKISVHLICIVCDRTFNLIQHFPFLVLYFHLGCKLLEMGGGGEELGDWSNGGGCGEPNSDCGCGEGENIWALGSSDEERPGNVAGWTHYTATVLVSMYRLNISFSLFNIMQPMPVNCAPSLSTCFR